MRDIFSLRNQTVIVTGGSGYLGSHMVRRIWPDTAYVQTAFRRGRFHSRVLPRRATKH